MKSCRGFSLIEMAFVLVIITLLLGGLLVPFATQVEQRRIAETQKTMEEIKEALIGYALSHSSTAPPIQQPYLPCPDATAGAVSSGNILNDGQEDRNPVGSCDQTEGNLPWATLGVGNQDAWGNRFHYSVATAFSGSSLGFGLGTSANIDVCSVAPPPGASACNPTSATIANNVPAVVVSFGKNGYGALSVNSTGGRNIPPAAASLDELANQPGPGPTHPIFVSRTLTLPGAGRTEFDDLVVWISPNVLFNRMVAAGKLP